MIANTFEFISVKDWCQLADSPATLFSKPRSYLALFEDAQVCLSSANWGPDKETPEGQLFYEVASTGGFAVKDLLAPLTITGSAVANLGPSIVKDDALLVLVDKHLALTESYGDERWKQYQLGTWPDAHNYPRQSIGSRLLSLFKTGKIAAPRIQRYTLEEP